MTIDLLAWISPVIGVGFFFLLEKYYFTNKKMESNRLKTICSLWAINFVINLLLSIVMLVPLVYLLAPLELFSFSKLNVPIPVSFVCSFLFLDLVSYFNHRLHHYVPFLWRIHRLHHSDREVDAMTTLLHHPLEMLTTFLVSVSFATIFDVPVIVLIVYALVLGLHAGFTHVSFLLPDPLADKLKFICVTPNFHKTHHSVLMKEGNSNFGSLFVFWDCIFNSVCYTNQQELNKMTFGIEISQTPKKNHLACAVLNPFK